MSHRIYFAVCLLLLYGINLLYFYIPGKALKQRERAYSYQGDELGGGGRRGGIGQRALFCFRHSHSNIWKLMKRYCCIIFIIFSLSACALSSVQGISENKIKITTASFNTVLANQSESAQSFLAKSNIPPT